MPIRIDRYSAGEMPIWAGQSARDTGISRWERCEWTLPSPLRKPPLKATAWDPSRASQQQIQKSWPFRRSCWRLNRPSSSAGQTSRTIKRIRSTSSTNRRSRQASLSRQPSSWQGAAHSMASEKKDANQQATVTAGAKANARQAADLGPANEGPK